MDPVFPPKSEPVRHPAVATVPMAVADASISRREGRSGAILIRGEYLLQFILKISYPERWMLESVTRVRQ